MKKRNNIIIKQLCDLNENTINKEFYSLNRKCRNNLHYNDYHLLSKEQLNIVKSNQKKYLDNALLIFNKEITYEFNFNYYFWLFLARKLKYLMNVIKTLILDEPKNFSKINRYFMNMSNSFYMYQLFYDKYNDYALMYNLRNYAVHNTLVITKLTLDIISGESNIIISTKELLTDKKMNSKWKKIIAEIIYKNEEI